MMPHKYEKVKLQMWYTSDDDRSLDFIKDLGEYVRPMVDGSLISATHSLEFVPKFVHYACPHCDSDFKRKNCVSDGQYCAMQKSFQQNLSGREVIQEHLRQYCIYDILDKKNQADKFFDYIAHVHQLCESRITERCSTLGIQSVQLTFEEVSGCVRGTFAGSGESVARLEEENSVLAEMLKSWNEYGSHLYPSVVINDFTFRGQLNPFNVFEAVCASFEQEPKACKRWLKKEGIKLDDQP